MRDERKCMVGDNKAYFIGWTSEGDIIENVPYVKTMGIVEYSSGEVHIVYPSRIQFVEWNNYEDSVPDLS